VTGEHPTRLHRQTGQNRHANIDRLKRPISGDDSQYQEQEQAKDLRKPGVGRQHWQDLRGFDWNLTGI